jgi:carboxypeptidase family protein
MPTSFEALEETMRTIKHFGLSTFILLCILFFPVTALAQQTGSIGGRVTLTGGDALPGVAVEATSAVLPQARTTATGANGEYRLPLLPPGDYQLTFTLGDMATETRQVAVRLDQNSVVDVTMGPEALKEEISVVAEAPLIDRSSAEIKSDIPADVIQALPVGQDYRDLQKLIPAVQYTEDDIRGPSAGGNGQDNVYKFDGVNVTLPLFGVLSAEPSSHDIDQVAVVTGGAKALDFNRSGGFTIDSVSKSGTNDFHGTASYQVQTAGMTGERDKNIGTQFEEDKDWAVASLGGPLVRERLFFYGSYFRPTVDRDNVANAYGEVPNFKSTRDEFFGKLSYQPTSSILLNGSYRDSDRDSEHRTVDQFNTATASLGDEGTLGITIAEGSWVIGQRSFLRFKYTDFKNETSSRPDLRFGFPIRIDGSVNLDVANLDRQGLLTVPTPIAGQTAYNDFIAPIIQRYGFLQNGVRTGGGKAGGGLQTTDDDFFRTSYEGGYDWYLGSRVTHELHVGYQRYTDEEDLARVSNGWGEITVPGGRTTFNGVPVFYDARLFQMGVEGAGGALLAPIHSEFQSQNVEINDTIHWGNWSFNAGVVASNDKLFGQDLKENSANRSGFEVALGHKYKMYELDFKDMIQPRLGVVWSYNGTDTVYANWARYYPAASSLPRAASWARNNVGREIFAHFDATGHLIGTEQVGSSSGKFFQPDLAPRGIDEFLLGTARRFGPAWTARAGARYRYGYNFWEDTNNNARIAFLPPPGIARELYVPDLAAFQREIGGSSYVIAELDGAFTKYYEASLEAERRGKKTFVRGTYVWSHYYGNFDQDNTTTDNDQSIFIGSSFIADGAGRQLWNFRYGDLRGDRRHQVKVYGYYELPWKARTGAFAIYQSGQPWEVWDVELYRALTSSTSDVSRFAEPAGSRRTESHYQLDLNYTQDFPLGDRYNLQLRGDLFNVTDNQTPYNIQSQRHLAGFGRPRSAFDPRRLQLAVRFEF